MFRVDGDIIEYDGKRFAVIRMPLCGARIDAVEALNKNGFLEATEAETMLAELMADVNRIIKTGWPDEQEKAIKAAFRQAVQVWIRDK